MRYNAELRSLWIVVAAAVLPVLMLSTVPLFAADEPPGSRPPSRREQAQAEKEQKQRELEEILLTVPVTPQEQAIWMTTWQRHLQVGMLVNRNSLQAISLWNKSPLRIEVIQDADRRHLSVNGRPTVHADWIIDSNKKLLLSTSPRPPLLVLQGGTSGSTIVDAVTTGPLCQLRMHPVNTNREPLELWLLYKVGTLGSQTQFATYYLIPGESQDAAMDSLQQAGN